MEKDYDVVVVTPLLYERALFEVKRADPPPHPIARAPVEGLNGAPIAMPLCEECAGLSDTEKGKRLKAALLLPFPGSRERKLN